jgi:superfamily II DNA or RNA helicase
MSLWKHQQDGVNLFQSLKKMYAYWDTGTGKTRFACACVDTLHSNNILVVCPKNVFISWQDEIQTYGLNPNIFTIMSYETFRNRMTDDKFQKFDFIIFDEAHRLKSNKAKVSKVALQLRQKFPDIPCLMLSGTPADKWHELLFPFKVLCPNQRPFMSGYSVLVNRYFFLDNFFNPKRLRTSQENYIALFKPYLSIVKREDVIELPELSNVTIKTDPIRKPNEIVLDKNVNVLTQFIAKYQIAQGVWENKVFNHTKLAWLVEFLKDNPDTVVFSNFVAPVKELAKHIDGYFITGDDKKQLETCVFRQDKPLIATYCIKEGLNLQRYKNVVFLSLPLAYRDYVQSLSRVYRAGQKNKVVVYHILGNAIDNKVYQILQAKKDVTDVLRDSQFNLEEI